MTPRLAPALQRSPDGRIRCAWCGTTEEYIRYHDLEWGRPERDDVRLFEKLSLEGFQAGLSWLTTLRKRENFRRAFSGFDPARIARFGGTAVRRLLADAGIVRHRGKIEAVINRVTPSMIPPLTDASAALSEALKSRGWRFVGPTTMYALFQAMGLVNDHIHGCFRRHEIEATATE